MQGKRRNRARAAAFAVLLTALGMLGIGAIAAQANAVTVPTTAHAVTHITDRPDNGHGGIWAYDTMDRTLDVTLVSPQPASVPVGSLEYNVTIADKGSFSSIVGALTPNQAVAGVKIAHGVKGSISGTYSLTAVAPAADTLTGVVPATENDNFVSNGAGFVSTGDWAKQAFATPVGVTVTGGAYEWDYQTFPPACSQKWVDSSTNGDGALAADGNITGALCPVTFPYGGHANYVAPTRETVHFKSSLPSWYMFRIVGPGPINGHMGWVHAQGGGVDNVGVYSGLEGGVGGHGYTASYTPVTGQGSTTPLPNSHGGYVFFVTNQPQTAAA
jgi:hypothetical protein